MQPFLFQRCIISREINTAASSPYNEAAVSERVIAMADINRPFENAVEKYSDMVTALCLLRLGNRQDAEDCYQNVFIKLYKKGNMLEKEPEYLKAWLIRVTLNECKNHFRFKSRHQTLSQDFVITFYEDESDRSIIEQIMSMKKIYREVIYLHYYCGYSVTELALLLKCSENTVKSRLKRGRDILKQKLSEQEDMQ